MSSLDREKILRSIAGRTFDLLVIGGGITGAGIAFDAALRGAKTVLIDMRDFAFGTSSRSTKLIHGGLRYLRQWEWKLVAETGRERAIVYENGPHVTSPQWMLLPIYKNGEIGKWSASLGLKLYDALAGVKRTERRKMLSREETLSIAPLLKREGLLGGGYYAEYQTDDARLTLETMKAAAERGARPINYVKAERFIYEGGKARGVEAVDQLSGARYKIFAKKIVNATGPWVEQLLRKDRSDRRKERKKSLRITKGIHLLFDQTKFPLKQAIYFHAPDGRMMFAIPRQRKTYVGTTDTDYEGDLGCPLVSASDARYVLNAIRHQFPSLQLNEKDIESSWAGLRPLIYEENKSPSEVSRKDEVWRLESGLFSVAGGKLTGYRKMAERVVDQALGELEREENRSFLSCRTERTPISGGHVGGSAGFSLFVKKKTEEGTQVGFSPMEAERLARRYGSNVDRAFALATEYRRESGLPLEWFVSVLYSIRYEMACSLTDFFARRTGDLYFRIASVYRWREAVARLMADELGWSRERRMFCERQLQKKLVRAVQPSDE